MKLSKGKRPQPENLAPGVKIISLHGAQELNKKNKKLEDFVVEKRRVFFFVARKKERRTEDKEGREKRERKGSLIISFVVSLSQSTDEVAEG